MWFKTYNIAMLGAAFHIWELRLKNWKAIEIFFKRKGDKIVK